jgi:hypothetical protein
MGGGPLFSCFIAFLCYNFSKPFEGVHEVPPPPPECIFGGDPVDFLQFFILLKNNGSFSVYKFTFVNNLI